VVDIREQLSVRSQHAPVLVDGLLGSEVFYHLLLTFQLALGSDQVRRELSTLLASFILHV